MNFLLIGVLAAFYPLLHIFNAFAFQFVEITPHIALVYLPAFLRLFNVLVLGPRDGTLATVLGGVFLMNHFNDNTVVGLLNVACSAGGPLVAISFFQLYLKRSHNLASLKDLSVLTLIYAPTNAVLHHLMWSQLAPEQVAAPTQMLWMTLGDVLGVLIGAYALRFGIRAYKMHRIDI